MKKLWTAIVRLFGWKFDIPSQEELARLRHCVLIEAPHTSIYDFLLGAACVWHMNLNARFFIKKEFFVFPLRRFLRWSGAMPVDRGNRANHMVETAVTALQGNKDISFIITPEGTRKPVKRFKRGFHEIAVRAGVPVAVTYIDYKSRHMGVDCLVELTGDFNADMRTILKKYENIAPRNASGWDYASLLKTYSE